MKILALESSAVSASAAVLDDKKVKSQRFINAGLTHSETLLPLVEEVLDESNTEIKDVDLIAITNGPGSFTGVRIGVATAKGLAFANNTKCVGVSTLEAIAYNFADMEDATICAVMDARRMQFYNGIFKISNGQVKRLVDDRAESFETIKSDLNNYNNVIIAGDGAKLFFESLDDKENIQLADDDKLYQNAVSVAKCAMNKKSITSNMLLPVYLRLSQAERELKLKKEN